MMRTHIFLLLILTAFVVAFVAILSEEEEPQRLLPPTTVSTSPRSPARSPAGTLTPSQRNEPSAEQVLPVMEEVPHSPSERFILVTVIDRFELAKGTPTITRVRKGKSETILGAEALVAGSMIDCGPFKISAKAGDLVLLSYEESKALVEVDSRDSYAVELFPTSIVKVTLSGVTGELDPGANYSLTLAGPMTAGPMTAGPRLTLKRVGEHVNWQLPPGDYVFEAKCVKLERIKENIAKMDAGFEVDIIEGSQLKVLEGVPFQEHRLILGPADVCELEFHNVDAPELTLLGPIKGSTDLRGIQPIPRTAPSRPFPLFQVSPGTYYAFEPKMSLVRRQEIVVPPGLRQLTIDFHPSYISGVLCCVPEDFRYSQDQKLPFTSGDVIRGIDQKRIGREFTFEDYFLRMMQAMYQDLSLELIIEGSDGEIRHLLVSGRDLRTKMRGLEFKSVID